MGKSEAQGYKDEISTRIRTEAVGHQSHSTLIPDLRLSQLILWDCQSLRNGKLSQCGTKLVSLLSENVPGGDFGVSHPLSGIFHGLHELC